METDNHSNGDAIQDGVHNDRLDVSNDSSEYDSDDDLDYPWKCNKCSLIYDDGDEQQWVSCSICNAHYDTKCIKVSKKLFRTLKNNKNLCWLCDKCRDKYLPDPNSGIDLISLKYKTLSHKIKKISRAAEDIADLQNQLRQTCASIGQANNNFSDSLTQVETNLKQEIHKIKAEVPAEATKQWADIVNKAPAANETVTVQQVKEAIKEVTAYDKEMELRSRGIVVYRAPESKNDTREGRKQDDLRLMTDLLSHIKCEEAQIISTDRLGRYDENREKDGRYRPIKVRFSSNTSRDQVLKSLFRLKDAEPRLKALSIRQDLNDAQRTELKTKLTEAYNKTKNSPDSVFRVRGGPGEYVIKQFVKNVPNPGAAEENLPKNS